MMYVLHHHQIWLLPTGSQFRLEMVLHWASPYVGAHIIQLTYIAIYTIMGQHWGTHPLQEPATSYDKPRNLDHESHHSSHAPSGLVVRHRTSVDANVIVASYINLVIQSRRPGDENKRTYRYWMGDTWLVSNPTAASHCQPDGVGFTTPYLRLAPSCLAHGLQLYATSIEPGFCCKYTRRLEYELKSKVSSTTGNQGAMAFCVCLLQAMVSPGVKLRIHALGPSWNAQISAYMLALPRAKWSSCPCPGPNQ